MSHSLVVVYKITKTFKKVESITHLVLAHKNLRE